jgi:hypothetical protein
MGILDFPSACCSRRHDRGRIEMKAMTADAAALAFMLALAISPAAQAENELVGGILGGAAGAGIGGAVGGAKGAAIGGVVGLGTGVVGAHLLSKKDKQASGGGAAAPAADAELTVAVQNELSMLGYDPGPVDGVYGYQTAEAIRAYQTHQGLPADGQVSLRLLDHLRATRAARAEQQPQPAPQSAGYTTPAPQPVTQQPLQPQPVQQQQQTTAMTVPPPPGTPEAECRPFEQVTKVGDEEIVRQGTACKQPDGTWKVVE